MFYTYVLHLTTSQPCDSDSCLLVLLVLAGAGVAAYAIWSRPTRARAHRHRHHQRRHRQPADRRPDRPAAGEGRRHGQEGPARSAVIAPDELRPTPRTTRRTPQGLSSQVRESRPRCGSSSGRPRIRSARRKSTLASTEAQVAAGDGRPGERAADLRRAPRSCRSRASCRRRSSTRRGRRTTPRRPSSTRSRSRSRRSASAVALARDRTPSRSRCGAARSQTNEHSRRPPPRSAQRPTSGSRYTEIHAPIDGIVDVRAVPAGRVRQARAADRDADQPRRSLGPRRRRGDLHRSRPHRRQADRAAALGRRARRARCSTAAPTPAFATQRDVSRTKRDIKTFEIRLRVDNARPPPRRRHDRVRAAAGPVRLRA